MHNIGISASARAFVDGDFASNGGEVEFGSEHEGRILIRFLKKINIY